MYRFVLPAMLLVIGSAALSADNYRAKQEARDQADLAKALAGFTQSGPPRSCIDSYRVRDTQRVGNTILYKYSPKEVYSTDTGGGCFGLRNGDAIITKTYSTQFCRGDIVRTVDLPAHIQSGSCAFGDFVPYKK